MKKWGQVNIPENWADVTFEQYKRMYPLLNELYKTSAIDTGYFDTTQLISIILNIPYENALDIPSKFVSTLLFVINDEIIDNKAEINHVNFKYKDKSYSTKQLTDNKIILGRLEYYRQITKNIENSLKNNDVTNVLITAIEDMTDEQKEIYNEFLKNCVEQRLLRANELAAIMIQGIVNDKFNLEQIKQIENDLLHFSCNTVIQIAFFLMNLFQDVLIDKMMQLIVNQLSNFYRMPTNISKSNDVIVRKVIAI